MERALKVLYMLHDARRSGVPAVAASFIRLAATIGVEPAVLFAYDGIYAQELRAAGIPVTTLGPRTPFVWRCKRFLMNVFLMVKGQNYDVIHIHSVKLAWSVLVARVLGLKVVLHVHELPRRIGWLLRTAMATADATVFCSQTCAAHFADVPARRKQTIINAMQFPDLPVVSHRNGGKLRIVMAASLNINKGQDLLLEAFAGLRNRDAELWLYGTTGLSAHGYVRDLKRNAAEQGIAERVFFPGPTSDVLAAFSGASVVVHTSWTESFGMALVEAQSCGVPVIAHDLEGMREVIVDGVTGFLVQPGDVDALAARINELMADPGLRAHLGAAGSRMVRERFNIASRVNDYIELYEELCRR
jgi:glycosyltransferase involved in cell wall biosynthesis